MAARRDDEDDLEDYEAPGRAPTRVGYRGLDVCGMGPPSSGGSTVGEALNILEGYRRWRRTAREALHRFLEASRYSFADRGAYLADPDFVDVPLSGLLSDSLRRRAARADHRPAPRRRRSRRGPCPATAARRRRAHGDTEGTSTTHLTVADRHGIVVSYTFTIESTGGNGIVVPGWGFLLNNELTDFDFDARHRAPTASRAASGRAARWRRRS